MTLQMTRVFDAPREVVFGWWSDAQRMQQWSGCKECTRCEIAMDFRVGGGFTQKMQIAGKGEYTVTGTYERIVAPELIVYRADLGVTVTRVTVEFREHRGGTAIVLTHEGLPDAGSRAIVSQGTLESFERLESTLSVAR